MVDHRIKGRGQIHRVPQSGGASCVRFGRANWGEFTITTATLTVLTFNTNGGQIGVIDDTDNFFDDTIDSVVIPFDGIYSGVIKVSIGSDLGSPFAYGDHARITLYGIGPSFKTEVADVQLWPGLNQIPLPYGPVRCDETDELQVKVEVTSGATNLFAGLDLWSIRFEGTPCADEPPVC